MAQFATFWKGNIDALERACLGSFSRSGHEVVVFSYESREPSSLYQTRSASEIMPERYLTQFVTDGRPNIAHFSDAFRVTMFTKEPFIWVDCDLFLRAPFTLDPSQDIFVREGKKNIIASLLRIANQRIASRALDDIMKLAGRDLPWASPQNIIPKAMVAEGYAGMVQKSSIYNPVSPNEFYKLLLPEYKVECLELCKEAQTIHLYNNILQKIGFYKDLLPPEGSYLHAILEPYAEIAGFIGTYPASAVRAMVEGWHLRFSGKELGLGAVLRRLGPAARTTTRRRIWA